MFYEVERVSYVRFTPSALSSETKRRLRFEALVLVSRPARTILRISELLSAEFGITSLAAIALAATAQLLLLPRGQARIYEGKHRNKDL
jgi:hypothetical protein